MKMRKILCLALAAILPAMLFGCSAPATNNDPNPATTVPTEPAPSDPKTYKVLFIGNSYTNTTMPDLFKQFATAAGYNVEVESVVKNSWELTLFADPTDTYGKQVNAHLTGDNQYDFVVLQEKSILTATPELPKFYTAVRNLNARIEAAGAKTILYSTWGRKTGSAALPQYGLTNESMTWKVASAYKAIGEELDIPVAYVGLAFYDIFTSTQILDVYDSDLTHPSYEGNYLSAATLFATMFQVDPTNVAFNGKLPADQAALLKEAARKAVFETPEIPEQYKTSSEGIG